MECKQSNGNDYKERSNGTTGSKSMQKEKSDADDVSFEYRSNTTSSSQQITISGKRKRDDLSYPNHSEDDNDDDKYNNTMKDPSKIDNNNKRNDDNSTDNNIQSNYQEHLRKYSIHMYLFLSMSNFFPSIRFYSQESNDLSCFKKKSVSIYEVYLRRERRMVWRNVRKNNYGKF